MKKQLHKSICTGFLSAAMILGSISGTIPKTTEAAMTEKMYTTNRKTASPEEASTITIDGKDIRKENVNGLTYKGFGFLSANSTSDLLLDYKAEQPEAYAKLMQYPALEHPGVGDHRSEHLYLV
ncbi:MAG: hypothetical protein IJ733_12935 [Lachnospiraceae bacterium]|nr:hypothetical protein [Lachnospiraceae bacterium]